MERSGGTDGSKGSEHGPVGGECKVRWEFGSRAPCGRWCLKFCTGACGVVQLVISELGARSDERCLHNKRMKHAGVWRAVCLYAS
jgi:hypothetical protein